MAPDSSRFPASGPSRGDVLEEQPEADRAEAALSNLEYLGSEVKGEFDIVTIFGADQPDGFRGLLDDKTVKIKGEERVSSIVLRGKRGRSGTERWERHTDSEHKRAVRRPRAFSRATTYIGAATVSLQEEAAC